MNTSMHTMAMYMGHHTYGGMPMYNTSPSFSDATPSPHMPVSSMTVRGVMHLNGDADLLDREQYLPISKRRKIVYLCESCGTSYTEKRALARHKHTNQHRRNLGLPLAQRYPCTTCEKSFSRDHDRVRHENETHKGLKRSAQRGMTGSSVKTDSPPQSDSTGHSDSLSPSEPDSHHTPASSATTHSRTPSHVFGSNAMTDGNEWSHNTTDTKSGKLGAVSNFSRPLAHATSNSSFITNGSQTETTRMGDMQERSWFADDSDSEDSRDPLKVPQLHEDSADEDDEDDEDNNDDDTDRFVYSAIRSTSHADSAIDMEWPQEREPKFPTIVTYDHRGESPADSKDRESAADEQRDKLAPLAESQPTSRPRSKHTSIITRRGKAQKVSAVLPGGAAFCVFCRKPFEDDPELLLPHLREHLDALKGEHFCKVCNIGFTHRADLDRHKASVDFFGYCGFPFHHTKQCTGHHPPSSRHNDLSLNDRDSVQLFAQLRNWEHAQLRAYIAEVQELLSMRSSRASTCYSVEALVRHSRDSFASMAFSINTCDSAPCDRDGDVKRGIGGLQQRLRMMSLKNTSSEATDSRSNAFSSKQKS